MIPIGRKGKFDEWLTDDGLLRVQGWAREGLTNEQIAYNMGISLRSFADWLVRFPALSASLKKGKEPVDLQVENALLKRALGYDVEEVTTEIEEVPSGKLDAKGMPILKQKKHIRKTVKHISPDTTAQIFWLKNRRPDRWRDKIENVQTVESDLLQSLMELERRAQRD